MNSITPVNIMLVEDDIADQKLIKASIKAQKIANELQITSNAEEALNILHYISKSNGNLPCPDLILLDLNMPGMGGKEFLKNIKSDEKLKRIPVVVLTTSSSEKDVIDSYKLQAAGYIHKPVTLEEFKRIMIDIEGYWFLLCRLPQKDE